MPACFTTNDRQLIRQTLALPCFLAWDVEPTDWLKFTRVLASTSLQHWDYKEALNDSSSRSAQSLAWRGLFCCCYCGCGRRQYSSRRRLQAPASSFRWPRRRGASRQRLCDSRTRRQAPAEQQLIQLTTDSKLTSLPVFFAGVGLLSIDMRVVSAKECLLFFVTFCTWFAQVLRSHNFCFFLFWFFFFSSHTIFFADSLSSFHYINEIKQLKLIKSQIEKRYQLSF